MEKREQLYEGKAKKVFATDDADLVIVDYKDDATAGDGAKKGTISRRNGRRLRKYPKPAGNFFQYFLIRNTASARREALAPSTVSRFNISVSIIHSINYQILFSVFSVPSPIGA